MTNKKLKSNRIQDNMRERDIINANGKLIMTALYCLHQTGVSANALVNLFQSYASSTVKQWRKNFEDSDVFEKKYKEELERIHVTERELIPIAAKAVGEIPVYSTKAMFATELAMFCSHVNRVLGYGSKRLHRMLDLMANYDGDCFKSLEEIGITLKGYGNYLYTRKEERKRKTTSEELNRLVRGREALRILQEERNTLNDS